MGFFNDSSPPPPPVLPPPPPPPEILDVIDEVTGTQTLTVNGPDGKKRRVLSRLPRTPQEEQFFRQGEEMMATALRNIQELYSYDPSQVVDFAPLVQTFSNLSQERIRDLSQIANFENIEKDIQAFRGMQRELVAREFNRTSQQTEESLAHRGLGRSTLAAETRAAMAREGALAYQQADTNAHLFGEDLKQRQLGREGAAFQLQEQGRTQQLAAASQEYALKQQHKQDLEQMRDRAISGNMQQFGLGAQLTGQDQAKALTSKAPELSQQLFAMQSADQLHRHHADVTRRMNQYQMDLHHHQNQPPSFGEFLLNTGLNVGGAMMTSPETTMLGRLGKKIV